MDNLAYQIMTQKVIERLEAGVIPWKRSWSGGGHPRNLVSQKPYRGINPFILACMGYAQRDWVTFRQAQELGGSVRKGEKSCPVVFWNWIEKKDKESGKKEKYPCLKYYNVFNVEQCEGIEKEIENLAVNRDSEPVEDCALLVSNYLERDGQLKIEHFGNKPCYIPSKDLVQMPRFEQFKDKESYHAVLFHELVHASGAKTRLDRFSSGEMQSFGSREYSKEELIAEMGAAFLCGLTGIETATIDNQAAYLQGWISVLRGDSKLLVQAGGKAQKAVDLITGQSFEEKTEDEQPTA